MQLFLLFPRVLRPEKSAENKIQYWNCCENSFLAIMCKQLYELLFNVLYIFFFVILRPLERHNNIKNCIIYGFEVNWESKKSEKYRNKGENEHKIAFYLLCVSYMGSHFLNERLNTWNWISMVINCLSYFMFKTLEVRIYIFCVCWMREMK